MGRGGRDWRQIQPNSARGYVRGGLSVSVLAASKECRLKPTVPCSSVGQTPPGTLPIPPRIHSAAHLESLGATVEQVHLPSFASGLPAYYVIALSEASSNLSRYDGVRYGQRAQREGERCDG